MADLRAQPSRKPVHWMIIALAGGTAAMAAFLGIGFVQSTHAALKTGAMAPDFSTQGALAGKPFSFVLSKALKKGPVVLYFFPAAFTSGCTVEAHEFAEATPEFEKMGATIIGVTAGNIDRIAEFSATDCRNKFPVAEANPMMIKAYDVALAIPGKSWSNRTSYVIAPDGKIILAYSAMSPEGHVKNTLAAVQSYEKMHH